MKVQNEPIFPPDLFAAYGIYAEADDVLNLTSGLINATWKIHIAGSSYILQKLNDQVFQRPMDIEHNTRMLSDWLKKKHPHYLFPAPLQALSGKGMVCIDQGYYRLLPFIKSSQTINVVETEKQAYEAAFQFGRFSYMFKGFDSSCLRNTIPEFHNLQLRWQEFESSIQAARTERLRQAQPLIESLQSYSTIIALYRDLLSDPRLTRRVTHHDTKISNVLLDDNGAGACVIDLDTIMPGYFTSDAGDMIRTYVCPVSEEESEMDRIFIRREIYFAVRQGYFDGMGDELSTFEKAHFFDAGKFMVYMQALRFATDFLQNDRYYGARYPGHNLVRAKNQVCLLDKLVDLEPELREA